MNTRNKEQLAALLLAYVRGESSDEEYDWCIDNAILVKSLPAYYVGDIACMEYI